MIKKTYLIIILTLILLTACQQSTPQQEHIWQEPRIISLTTSEGPFDILFYPNQNTDQLIIRETINDDYRFLNVIILSNPTQPQIESIQGFANRNNLTIIQ